MASIMIVKRSGNAPAKQVEYAAPRDNLYREEVETYTITVREERNGVLNSQSIVLLKPEFDDIVKAIMG